MGQFPNGGLGHFPGVASNTAVDLAIVELGGGKRTVPEANMVPDPRNSRKKFRIKQVLDDEDLPKLMLKPVFKVGRTTGLTGGQVVNTFIRHRTLTLPNRKLYLYRELFAVRGKGHKQFSDHGDSGAMVYTGDGRLVGFVVGADSEVTLCTGAQNSLDAMGVRLLGAQDEAGTIA